MLATFTRQCISLIYGAEPDCFAYGGEGCLLGFVAVHQAVDYGPELGGVVGLAQVGQLVDEDVVDEARRELQGGPVDVDPRRAVGGAG